MHDKGTLTHFIEKVTYKRQRKVWRIFDPIHIRSASEYVQTALIIKLQYFIRNVYCGISLLILISTALLFRFIDYFFFSFNINCSCCLRFFIFPTISILIAWEWSHTMSILVWDKPIELTFWLFYIASLLRVE